MKLRLPLHSEKGSDLITRQRRQRRQRRQQARALGFRRRIASRLECQ